MEENKLNYYRAVEMGETPSGTAPGERRLKPLRPVATSALVRPVRRKTHSEKRTFFSELVEAVPEESEPIF